MGLQHTFTIKASIAEGFEPTGEFRGPRPGDWIIASDGEVMLSRSESPYPRMILRPVWTWPECVQPGWWLSHNVYGVWFLSEKEPMPNTVSWEFGCRCVRISDDITRALRLTLPPLSEDWKKSPRQKPL